MVSKPKRIIAVTVCSVILAIVLALNIGVAVMAPSIDKFIIGFKPSKDSAASRADGEALAEQIQAEGTVLVQNKDDVLPLSKTAVPKVNVFGWAATDWVISGSGSGQVKRAGSTDLYGALTEYGIEYNMQLADMYKRFREGREFSRAGSHAGTANQANPTSSGSLHSFNYEFSRLYEPDINDGSYYTPDLLSDAKSYSDTAIVVIGRVSGESNDSPKVQYKNCSGKGMPADKYIDKTRTYLEISTEEEGLLKYVGENYDNVIVLINSTNVMELGFMETIPGLDSCLVVGTTGTSGAKALPKLIYGDITPSGRLADTYAYDLSTASTYTNTGSGNDTTNFYTNGAGLYPTTVQHTNGSSNVPYEGVAYTDYCEGVYVGYKWYETADETGFWNSDYAKRLWNVNGYDQVVQYPFGYGLSYAKFSWTISLLEFPDNSTLTKDDVIKVGVTVKNISETYSGQEVVQLYYSAPYDSIEKASVNLGAFAKTQNVLKPGESEYVELTMKVEDMASYDYQGFKVPGGGYVLEKGNYTLTLRDNAHTLATDKITADGRTSGASIVYKIAKDTVCQEDTVQNRFTGKNTTDGVAIDGNSDRDGGDVITYLSRANFQGTFPEKMAANRAMTDDIKALNLYTSAMANQWKENQGDVPAVTFGDTSQGGLVYEDGKINEYGIKLGKNYDDPEWENLLDRIKKDEMTNLVLKGYTQTSAVASIGKPQTNDLDGPNQIGSFAGVNGTTGFSSIVLAQSWNVELAYSMGLTFGKQCAENNVTGWYGPGVNVHRSPFGGRNYEYYSEDALMSGLMCAKVVSAAKNRGIFCYLKHVCLYETESGRDGMYTWVTEQALREIYLKPFEIAVKEGGSTAIMTSYGRIGAVWTGASSALLQEVIEGEWGFRGAFLTDYSDHAQYMDADAMIRAGGDLFMTYGGGRFDFETNSNAFNRALRNSTKDLVYMWLNALATNAEYNAKIESGEIVDSIVIPSTPEYNFRWYIPVLIGVDLLAVGGCGTWLYFTFRKKKEVVAE